MGVFSRLQTLAGEVLSGDFIFGSHATLALSTLGAAGLAWWIASRLLSCRRIVHPLAAEDVRIAVITGAASGIGLATVLRLEQLGWHVIAVDFNEEQLKKLDERTSGKVCTVVCDVSSPESCEQVRRRAEEVATKIGVNGLSGLANVAGMMQMSPAAAVEDEQLRRILAVNCEAPVRLTRLLMPLLLKSKQPRICNVASIAAEICFPWGGVYSATKGFINNFSDTLRREAYANRLPLCVSIVKPGFIDTPMSALLPEQQLKWCENNVDNPFAPALKDRAWYNAFVLREKRLPGKLGEILKMFFGDPGKPIRTSADDVAADIVHSFCSDRPLQKYFTGTFVFKVMINIARFLPPGLRDAYLMAWL